jgi:hypothetical protein
MTYMDVGNSRSVSEARRSGELCKTQGCRVHAVQKSQRSRTIVEDMAKMGSLQKTEYRVR